VLVTAEEKAEIREARRSKAAAEAGRRAAQKRSEAAEANAKCSAAAAERDAAEVARAQEELRSFEADVDWQLNGRDELREEAAAAQTAALKAGHRRALSSVAQQLAAAEAAVVEANLKAAEAASLVHRLRTSQGMARGQAAVDRECKVRARADAAEVLEVAGSLSSRLQCALAARWRTVTPPSRACRPTSLSVLRRSARAPQASPRLPQWSSIRTCQALLGRSSSAPSRATS